MNKITILVGLRESGKSRLSRLMMKERISVNLDGQSVSRSSFPFHIVNPDTELLVIDDLPMTTESVSLLSEFHNGTTINKKYHGPFRWHGDVIGIFHGTLSDILKIIPDADLNKFNIFELKSCNR
jgi:hypothetical protein